MLYTESMKLGIIVPWRSQPSRSSAFVKTISRLSDQFPDSTIYCSDKPGERFSVAGARNRGCLEAIEDGCDALLVIDADMMVEKDAVERAVEKAKRMVSVCLPYTSLNRMDSKLSTSVINDEVSFEGTRSVGHVVQGQLGGAYVMESSTFLRLNGWDERFVGWGFEDDALREAHRVLLDRDFHRSAGHGITFHHLDRDQGGLEDNRQRFYGYTGKSKAEMLELISGNMVEESNE